MHGRGLVRPAILAVPTVPAIRILECRRDTQPQSDPHLGGLRRKARPTVLEAFLDAAPIRKGASMRRLRRPEGWARVRRCPVAGHDIALWSRVHGLSEPGDGLGEDLGVGGEVEADMVLPAGSEDVP